MAGPTPTIVPTAPIDASANQRGTIPFRQATTERAFLQPGATPTITANQQRLEVEIQGTGFIYGMVIRGRATAAANAAAVAYNEDAPWNAFDSVVLFDSNGEIVNVSGFNAFLANLINGDYRSSFLNTSADTDLYQLLAGGAANSGSFTFAIRVPVGINRRDLIGILGNQDRSQQYTIRTDLAASGAIYSVAPTALPPMVIERMYESFSVPMGNAPTGQPQVILPPSYGTLRFTTQSVSEAHPNGGATVNHYLRRLGKTVRWIALVFRSNGSRATAQANAPTQIQFQFGDETLFNEPYWYRRGLMHDRYSIDFPDGVIVYDNIHDFWGGAGQEMGDDYYHTALVQNAQFQVAYPAGFGATANSLTFVTDDMLIPGRN